MKELVAAALEELRKAAESIGDLSPGVPMPRVRVFEFAPGLVWPGETPQEGHYWYLYSRLGDRKVLGSGGFKVWADDLTEMILKRAGGQPRKVLRALRRIQAATEWCRRRAEGRRRAAQEVLRQRGVGGGG